MSKRRTASREFERSDIRLESKVNGRFHPNLGIRLTLGCAALACAAHACAAPAKSSQEPIDVTAQFEEVDGKNKTVFLRKVRIAQGNMTLTADQGQVTHGVENAFDDSVWVFKGAVKVTLDQGMLSSDEARVTFATKFELRGGDGKPAPFSRRSQATRSHGHHNITDVGKGFIRLTQDAFLDNGQYEVHGDR